MRNFSVAAFSVLALLAGPAVAYAVEFDITPAEHAACDGDATRLCVAAYPNVSRMLGCMVSNRPNLTPLCLRTFDEGLRKRHIKPSELSAAG